MPLFVAFNLALLSS